jgi:hypothetical protein
LTPGLTDEQKEKIYDELEENITTAQQNALNPTGDNPDKADGPGGKEGDAGDESTGDPEGDVVKQLSDDFEEEHMAWAKK